MRRNPKESIFDNMDEKQQGTIIRKPGSKKIYLLFYYFGRRVEKSTGLDDSPENRGKVRTWLNRQMEKIQAGNFNFAEAFPGATEKEKKLFAVHEGRHYAPPPQDIAFDTYVEHWQRTIGDHFDSFTLKITYNDVIGYWLLPYFKDMPLSKINSVEVKKFMVTFKQKKGKNKGKRLSKARAKNIISVLRTIYFDAIDEYGLINLPDPFRKVKKNLPKKPPKKRGVFRFDEWARIIQRIDPWIRPMIEFMVMTGLMPSETVGLRKSDIFLNHIMVRNSIVLQNESDDLKTTYRYRDIPITNAIRLRLEEAKARTTSDHIFTRPDGSPFYWKNFEKYWARVLKAADVPYQPPYCVRHTFAAWALTLRIDPLKLVRLMGHGSKKMVYETYGNYVDGLEEHIWSMLNYFGRDFIEFQKPKPVQPLEYYANLGSMPIEIGLYMPKTESPQPTTITFGESFGESRGPNSIST